MTLQFAGNAARHRSSLPVRCDRSSAMRSESASPTARWASRSARWPWPSGLSVPQACALSLLMFTGASQFAFVGLIGGGAAAAVATALLLGARNALYGLRLAPYLRPRGLAAHFVIDESAAMAVRDTPADTRLGFWSTGLAVFVFWNVATLIGALAGNAISDPNAFGPRRRRPGRVPRAARPAPERAARAAGDRAHLAAVRRARVRSPFVARGHARRWSRRRVAAARRAGASRREPRSAALMWGAILVAAAGCYALKLAGLSVPQRVLDGAARAARRAAAAGRAARRADLRRRRSARASTRARPGSPRRSSRCCSARRSSSSSPPRRSRPRCSGSSSDARVRG